MFTPISEVMQHLDVSGEEAAALIKELAAITGNDQTLRAILAKLRPELAREPLPPPPKVSVPHFVRGRRRRGIRAIRMAFRYTCG
jgi:hypothetical protein